MITSAHMAKLAKIGLSDEQVDAVVGLLDEMVEAAVAPLAKRRASERDRKARYRAGNASSTGQSRDETFENVRSAAVPVQVSPKVSPKDNNQTPILTPSKFVETQARDAAFEKQFWPVWPNKAAKQDAKRAFAKVWQELPAILEGVEIYIASKPADRDWMHAATFLNGRRWEDRPAALPRAGPNGHAPPKTNTHMDAITEAIANARIRNSAYPPD